jgi:hypothetical protein
VADTQSQEDFWAWEALRTGTCDHPGCGAPLYRETILGRYQRWCYEHGTPKWAMRRRRAWEKRYGVAKDGWPRCCRELGKPCAWHLSHTF